MEEAKTFRCPWSKTVTFITLCTPAIFGLILWQTWDIMTTDAAVSWVLYGVLALTLPIFAYTFISSPRRIVVDQDRLTIHCWGKEKAIALTDITEVGVHSFTGSIRLCGSSGMGGYLWWFWNRSLGRFYAYVTDPGEALYLKTDKRTYVISCEKRGEMIELLKK